MKKEETIRMRIDSDLKARLEKLAAKKYTTVTALVTQMIITLLEAEKPKPS